MKAEWIVWIALKLFARHTRRLESPTAERVFEKAYRAETSWPYNNNNADGLNKY